MRITVHSTSTLSNSLHKPPVIDYYKRRSWFTPAKQRVEQLSSAYSIDELSTEFSAKVKAASARVIVLKVEKLHDSADSLGFCEIF